MRMWHVLVLHLPLAQTGDIGGACGASVCSVVHVLQVFLNLQ